MPQDALSNAQSLNSNVTSVFKIVKELILMLTAPKLLKLPSVYIPFKLSYTTNMIAQKNAVEASFRCTETRSSKNVTKMV